MATSFRHLVSQSFSKLLAKDLLPFYGLEVCYALFRASDAEMETFSTAALKIAPVWYLILYIQRRRSLSPNDGDEAEQRESYRRLITIGMILSSLGDVFLVFQSMFIHGVAAFASAHVFYILGFRTRCANSKYAWVVYPFAMLTSPQITSAIEAPALASAVSWYSVAVITMLHYALCGFESYRDAPSLLAAAGALIFVLSDTLIGMDMFVREVPYAELLVMTNYYLAQLLLALSAC